MSRSVPELRPVRFVLLAYAVAPATATGILWLVLSILEGIFGQYTVREGLYVLPILIIGGGFVGLIVEFFFVTPFLLIFRRYRWSWINIWWFAGYGLVLGEAIHFLLDSLGPHHWFGWGAVLQGVSVSGFTGTIAAIVFYFIAVRRVRPSESPVLLSPHESAA